MKVELKRSNGWKVPPRKVDSHDEVRYGLVHETQIKKIAVLIRAPGDYKCSQCKHREGQENCVHERAVADTLSRVSA